MEVLFLTDIYTPNNYLRNGLPEAACLDDELPDDVDAGTVF